MNREDRLQKLLALLQQASDPLSGSMLAKELHVSRQVVVQDITLLRERENAILATRWGYILEKKPCQEIIKVHHFDDRIEEELNTIVDAGAWVKDVFVQHETYGRLQADLAIHSRRDVQRFMEDLRQKNSTPLTHLTNGVHYHTIQALDPEAIQEALKNLDKLGFLC